MKAFLRNNLTKISLVKNFLKQREIRNFLEKKYPNEGLLLKGKHKTNSLHPSLVAFTVHRCASQLMVRIFKIIEKNTDMTGIHLEGYRWSGGQLQGMPLGWKTSRNL